MGEDAPLTQYLLSGTPDRLKNGGVAQVLRLFTGRPLSDEALAQSGAGNTEGY
ncbi:MAG: hypothetical protein MK101_02870 [Phycisphaerales bacterium]|nr:hypothetical protein [Phycisphaerales bacterium]